MEKLPVEVITHILSFVGISDRKEAALVCRKWYDASLDPILTRETIVTFHAPETTGDIFSQLGRRKTPNLVLDQIDGSFRSKNFLLNSCRHLTENLESICLKGSSITEGLFTELIALCKNLKSLDISFCNSIFMSGKVLEDPQHQQTLQESLAKLTELNISSIRYISDVTFSRLIYVCPGLEKLHLGGNQVTFHSGAYYGRGNKTSSSVLTFGTILDCIEQRARNIKALTFSRTSIDDDSLLALVAVPELRLTELFLSCCREITDRSITKLATKQTEIEVLDLSHNTNLAGSGLSAICLHMPSLRVINLNKCTVISESALENLAMLSELERFEIASNFNISSRGLLRSLSKGKLLKLKHLNLGCCSGILNDSFIVGISQVLHPSLTYLDLNSSKLTDIGVQYICTFLTNLRVLILRWNSVISDAGFLGTPLGSNGEVEAQRLVNMDHKHDTCKCHRRGMGENILNLPKKNSETQLPSCALPNPRPVTNLRVLERLDISHCPRLTDETISVLQGPNLRSLSMQNNPNLTDGGLCVLGGRVSCLEALDVSQCAQLANQGLTALLLRQRRLRMLSVAQCDLVTDHFLQALSKHGTRLRRLDLSMCGGLSAEAVDRLETSLPLLRELHRRLVGAPE